MSKDWTLYKSERRFFYSRDWRAVVAWLIPILLLIFICGESVAKAQAQIGERSFDLMGSGSRGQSSSRTNQASYFSRDTNSSQQKGATRQTSFEGMAGAKVSRDSGAGKFFKPARVLAIVAGQPIFEGDLLLQVNEIIESRAADAPDNIKQKMVQQGIRQLLPRLMEQKMMYHQALAALPDPSRITKIKEDLYKQMDTKQLPTMLKRYQVKNLAQLDARLRSLGSSWRAVKEQVAEQEIAKFGIQSKIQIDKEIGHRHLWKYYVDHIEDYKIEAQVRFEHLMVSFGKTADRDKAWNKIAKMGDEVVYGARFKDVAKKSSDGFYASKGGQYDWTKKGDLTNKILEKKIFSSPVGKLGDIFESDQGYHIIRVIEKQEAGHVPFAETQEKIREKILQQRQVEMVKKIMSDVKKQVPYKIYIEGVKF